jgi:hypothetical protein
MFSYSAVIAPSFLTDDWYEILHSQFFSFLIIYLKREFYEIGKQSEYSKYSP